MAIYEKSVRFLMQDMVSDLALKKGGTITRNQVIAWFTDRYPKVKQGTIAAHLTRMSTNARSRLHHNIKPEDDLFYQIDGSTYRLYDEQNDPAPIVKSGDISEDFSKNEVNDIIEDRAKFAYEKDLQNFLTKNLGLLEPGLTLFEDDGITGIEYSVGGRYIDILALDNNNDYVVIELKVSRGYDRVIGQLLRYVSWIKKYQAEDNQKVRGIIIAREISEDLILACDGLENVDLFEYQLSVSLNKVE